MSADRGSRHRRPRPAKRLPGLERWLEEWAQDEAVATGRLRRYVLMVVVASMLDATRDGAGEPRFLFKGGASLELRFGHEARTTQDLDAVFRGELDEAVSLIDDAVGAGWMDVFFGRVSAVSEIPVRGARQQPQRIVLKVTYAGKPFGTLPLEVAPPEGRAADAYDVVAVRPLDPVGIDVVSDLPCLPLRYQIAQKLHACTERLGGGRVNDRVRDVADLLMIDRLALPEAELASIRKACVEIFEVRNAHDWPPLIEPLPGWDDLWNALVEEEGLPVESVADACELAQDLVDRIDSAT